jgi:hypothetical protein
MIIERTINVVPTDDSKSRHLAVVTNMVDDRNFTQRVLHLYLRKEENSADSEGDSVLTVGVYDENRHRYAGIYRGKVKISDWSDREKLREAIDMVYAGKARKFLRYVSSKIKDTFKFTLLQFGMYDQDHQ